LAFVPSPLPPGLYLEMFSPFRLFPFVHGSSLGFGWSRHSGELVDGILNFVDAKHRAKSNGVLS